MMALIMNHEEGGKAMIETLGNIAWLVCEYER